MESQQNKENALSTTKHINLMEIFSKINNVEENDLKMTPSAYIKEMSLTMEERYKKLIYMTNTMKGSDKTNPSQLKIIPKILIFQRFEPRSTNSLILEIKNVGKSLIPVKICCPNSVYFSANFLGAPVHKLASGLSVEYEISFTPKEARDYRHHLTIISKECTFEVPIIAIGPRPLLDIPDQILLNPSPVKIATNKFIVVRNIGTAPAVFNFITESKHFQMNPSKGILGVHDSMPLNISFESSKVEEVTESVQLALETGEKLFITLHGSAENVSVRLDKNSVVHEDTYIGLRRCKTVRLINNSSSIIKFSWKKNKTPQEDLKIIESLEDKYKKLTEVEILKDANVIYSGLSTAEKHKLSCERILQDELRSLEKEEFNFSHEAFTIMPQKGEVWPKGFVEIIISFEPKVCGISSAEAYLEASGKDTRLPLRIKGIGLGPNIVINVKTLDIYYIYLCSPHRYEVIAENKGDIAGTIEYLPKALVFGGKAEVIPNSRHLGPGEIGSFIISFTSNRQGDFTEKLYFSIKETREEVVVILKGKVISPTLHFGSKQIDFGVIPVGFPKVEEVTLNNLSVVPVTFSLRILSDGDIPSISYEQFAKFIVKPALPQRPKEFQIDPEESVVEPFSSKKVKVTLTPNRIGHFQTHLEVDMWDSNSGAITCPISFRPMVATLTADPDFINIPFCFINFPYTRSITLKNLSKVPAFFYIIPSDPNKETTITFSASIPQGMVEPRDFIKIDITVITSTLGRQMCPINLLTFGNDEARELCRISCVGQGPVITLKPLALQWDEISLLEKSEKILEISNESPIPASLTMSLVKHSSPWTISPSSLTIEPEKSVDVTVGLLLSDRGKFKDTLKINTYNGKTLQVHLSATGVGSSLKITPYISPTYHLGTLFSNKKYEFEILLENKGNKTYGLIWSPFPEYRTFANAKFITPPDYPFRMGPTKMDILPGEEKKVILEAHSPNTGCFNQTFYCFASIGVPAKELHLTSEVIAEFVGPLINFDKTEIKYWYNVGCESIEKHLEDTVNIINLSVLPMSVHISTNYPFCLITEFEECIGGIEVSLNGFEAKELHVRFMAEPNKNKVSKSFKGSLSASIKNNTRMSSVCLKGEVNYPNLLILPKNVNFGYVPVGISAYLEVYLVNTSPLTVHYSINWNTDKSQLVHFEKPALSSKSLAYDISESSGRRGESEMGENAVEEEGELLTEKNSTELIQNSTPPVKPVLKMPEIEISKSDIKAALFPLTRNYYNSNNELISAYKMTRFANDATNIFTGLFDITPFYGKLDAFCSQVLLVRFYSETPVNARLGVTVSIKSGPEEVFTINAISADIDFQLSDVELDFGQQLFCETRSKVFRIQNTAAMPFTFEANTMNDQVCLLNENFPLGKGVLTVSPKLGIVKGFESTELIVRYHPGVPGKFVSDFQLQIAYLDPIRIKVKGFGVFPQVCASLPRPDIFRLSPEIGYLAVASITPEWVFTGFVNGSSVYDFSQMKPYRSRESMLDKYPDDELNENWEVVKYFNFLPSEIDICLAIERILAYNLISKSSSISTTFAVYARTIPHFSVPAYDLDFGVCMIGRTVEQNVTITNFGPLPVILYGIFEPHLKEEGIHIRLKNRNELKIGACLPFMVAFHPRKSKYKKKYEKIESIFYFEIYHGPRIPIHIFAVVTYPHVITSLRNLRFGEVICGCCKVICLKLQNPGFVTAQWNMHVRKGADVGMKLPPGAVEGKPMFHLSNNSGVLNAGEFSSVQVSFKPEFGGSFYAVLNIRVIDSLEELGIPLLGSGIEPKLNISQRLLNFKSTLPYPHKVEKIFTVDNPCPFPIEYYFPAFDEQIYEEEKILRAVTLYYQNQEILLPVRRPGEGLPTELVDFYHSLLDGLNAKYIEDEREKILAEKEGAEENQTSLLLLDEADSLLVPGQNSFYDKKKKKIKKMSRSRTSTETNRPFTASNENGREPNIQSVFEKKTSLEIDDMLQDYIASLWNKEPCFDPVHAALKTVMPPVQEEEYCDGTLIIFYGAPYSNFIQLANRAAVYLNLLALNIDRIVLEEAAFGRCAAGFTAKELIEQAYLEYVGIEPKKSSSCSYEWEENGETIQDNFNFELEFEEIQRKFNALLVVRENAFIGKARNGLASAKSDTSRKLEKSGTPTTKPQMNVNAPIANISEEIVTEILKFRLSLEVGEGLIIEDLHSVFINSPPKALISILKAAGNIKDIIVVFMVSNYAQYNRQQLNLQAEQDLAKFQFREKILQILEEEPEEVFESLNLSSEEAQNIRKIFIAQRHEMYEVFEKKKDVFYEVERMKKEALKQDLPVPSLPLNVQFENPVITEKKEKENQKKNKTSEVSNRLTESDAKTARLKRDTLESEFLSFEMDFIEMMAVIDNWDQRLGALVADSGMDVKMKKGHSPRKAESYTTGKPKGARGVFLWLVDVSNPENKSFTSCCFALKKSLLGRVKPSESNNWPLDKAEAMTFSVAKCPSARKKDFLKPIFTISATENVVDIRMMGEDFYEDLGEYVPVVQSVNTKLNRSLSSISFKSRRKGSAISKRRRSDSRMANDSRTTLRSKKNIFSAGIDENQLKPRCILQPGEMQSYRVRYYPREVGEWKQVYDLEFVNWHKGDSVQCIGFCDIPHLDMTPEILFPAVEHSKPLTTTFTPAYYYQEDAYDFGSIITFQPNDAKKTIKKSATFTLSNKSSLPVDLCIILAEEGKIEDSSGSEHIKFTPDKFWLTPGQSKQLFVTANPAKNGSIMETLLLIVKDNPKLERIKVKCEGVRANVAIEPKIVNFDRLLLHRKEYRRAVLTNHNTTQLFVSLKGIDVLPSQFTFSHRSGWLPPLGSLIIEIDYNATEVQLIYNHPIIIQVFDNNEQEDPVQELTMSISAEAYDAALDIIFANADEDHIDFGDIRVENNYTITFHLKNVGKYQLGYKIDMDQKYLTEIDNNNFYVTPLDGKLFPGKLYPVTVNFVAQEEVSWKRVPLFKITLVEPYFGDELIAAIPIGVSARSHFSRYKIKPSNDFNFGHIKVGSVTTRSILIENKGHFSLSYYIEFQAPVHSTEESAEAIKKSSKLSASSKEKADKGKKSRGAFKTGAFEIAPLSGTAESGHTAVVNIICSPSEVRVYEEKIIIFVNESLPPLKKGNPMTISAEGCLPVIQFDDYKSLFREHFVCKNEDELASRTKPGSYTVYTENNNLFSFKNVCVNKTAEARIHLQNSGLIDSCVTAFVTVQSEEDISRTSSMLESKFFSLSPEKLIIEPYNSGCLLLTFKPEALEVYKARLIITLQMPDAFKDVVKVLNLWGNGVLPKIEVTEPNSKLPEGQIFVNFPPTSAGQSSASSIAFSNTGVLDCRVIMELYKFQNGIFKIVPKPSTEKMLKIWELTKPIDHTAIVSLSPGDVAEFNIIFSPLEVQSYTSQIKLFIVDNPFENWCFKLAGEVFFEEVVIEKIRTALPFLSENEEESRSSGPVAPGQYFVSFSECYVKKKSKVLLRLSNKTEKDYFKFEWDEVQSISVFPLSGHLYPNSHKEILIVFYPEEPMELEDVTIACMLNKIILERPPELSWDSRLIYYQRQSKSETSARNYDKKDSFLYQSFETVKVTGDEPEYEVVPESNRMLYVNVSGIADYSRLICETTKIIFKNTFMFQTRIHPLVLENPGNIALEYKLTLKSVTFWPIKENKMSQIGERSLLRLRPTSRPHSSFQLTSSDSHQQALAPRSRCGKRPRPLSSVPFLDLTKNSLESNVIEQLPGQVIEEPKTSNYNPFTIENVSGRILPKDKAYCNIIFSPLDINEYKAVLSIWVENIHPECYLPEIEVTASSVMPYCHFDIPESDYLESGRRDYTRPGPIGYAPGIPLHPDTKTIEIKVLGIGVTVPIKFHVINPTEEDYTFSWVNISQTQPEVVPSLHCSTVDGRIRAGRQQLMVFSFVSQTLGITESFWKFSIPKYSVETPFLFVSDVRQPAVYFLSNHVNLRPTFIGSSSTDSVILINNEENAFEFSFVNESLFSEGKLNAVKVEPFSGRALPNSETSIRVEFTGKTPGKTTFNLKCKVKTFKEPLTVTVEVITYAIQPLLAFEDLKKVKHFPDANKENVIDFGTELNPNMPETITLTFTSLSKTSFYYDWEYDREILESRHCKIRFSVKAGHVASFSRGKCDITVVFNKKSSLVNFPLKLRIRRGPTFRFVINASASIPPFEFSFTSYDFGPCFLQEKDICFYETALIIRNKDTSDLFLECILPESSAFSYSLPKAIIPTKKEIIVPLGFHPKECSPYEDELKFIINGIYERSIKLKGCGTDFKVGLVDPEDTTISLGAVKIGKMSTCEFSIVNKSLAPATVLVGFSDQLPVRGRHLARPNEYPINLSQDHRLTGLITIFPSTAFRIKPQEEFTLSVLYTPLKRSAPFSETVCLQYQERVEPLCMLTGCCLGPEISLDRNFLNFGAVVESCTSTMKLKLVNSGNIGARFQWDTTQLSEYEIFPVAGYCSPESNVTINVTFIPTAIENCIKKSVACHLQLSENEAYPPLNLDLMGDCIAFPEPTQVLTFECIVRESDKKTVEIENPTGIEWQLIPVISGEYFRGFDALIIPSLSSSQYEINYYPLTMTEKKNFHEGSVFFRLPNGRGLLYQLKGVSLPPNPEEVIEREIPCKTKYVELLKIKNWLQYPQRFRANISCVDNHDDLLCNCTGFEKLEVPALAQKEYSLNFFAYNVGYLRFHVTFVNEETKEYLWYDIMFNVVMCGPLEVISLKSGVRQTCKYELKLENPLKNSIQYKLESTSPDIHFEKIICDVPPQQSEYVILSFTPIHPGEKTEKLTVSCLELGVFPRELRLIAVEALPDPPRPFEASLGTSQTQSFIVKNLSPTNATLRCKTDSNDFLVNEQGNVGAGQSTNIEVTFEPSEIGSSTGTLFVESEQAGNFVFHLLGMCMKPLAKGPLILKQGSGVNIPFKNVFKKSKEFHMYVDNPAFVLKATEETLSPKEEIKIFVGLQKAKYLEKLPEYRGVEIDPKFPVMGQLVVECFNPYVKWQFYLKGVLEK